MQHSMRNMTVALVVTLGVFTSGCATTPIPEPKASDSSLLIVGLRLEMESMVNVQKFCGHGRLFVRRITGKGAPATIEHSSDTAKYPECYYYFANIPPGTYEVDHFYLATPGTPVFTFPSEVVSKTKVEVKPRSVTYMADYSARFKQSTMLTVPHKVIETGGDRSAATAARAIEVFKKNYGQSPWLLYPVNP